MFFFSRPLVQKHEHKIIVDSIRAAEKNTSGEVRVLVEKSIKGSSSVQARAHYFFLKHKMYKTQSRNAVLFYISLQNKSFYILGDEGIHQKLGQTYWDTTVAHIVETIKHENNWALGISKGIEQIGEALKKHFPYQSDDKNELKDEIIIA